MSTTLLEFKPLSADLRGTSTTRPTFGTRNGHRILQFPPSLDGEAFYGAIMPEAFAGLDSNVVVEFMVSDAVASNVVIGVAFERLEAGVTDLDIDGFFTEKTVTVAVPGTSGQLARATLSFATPAEIDGIATADQFRVRIRRVGTNVSDNSSATVQMTIARLSQVTTGGGGGGGGGFFADGVGLDAGIGKGVVAPSAAGTNSLAQGNASTANGQNSLSVGDTILSTARECVGLGLAIDFDAEPYNFGQGRALTFAYAQSSFGQGYDLQIYGETFSGYTGKGHFCQGQNNYLRNAWQYVDSGAYNIYRSESGFVQGRDNTMNNGINSYYGYGAGDRIGPGSTSIGFGNMIQGSRNVQYNCIAAVVLGNDNNIRYGEHAFVTGYNNTIYGSHYNEAANLAVMGSGHVVNANTSNCFVHGNTHVMPLSSQRSQMFGQAHSAAFVDNFSVFGSRGYARNDGAFVRSIGGVFSPGPGRHQVSDISNLFSTNAATANQVLETFPVPNRSAILVEVRVAVHMFFGGPFTNESAVFYLDGRILVNKAGVSGDGSVQFTQFGGSPSTGAIALNRIDAGGTDVALTTMDIIPSGTTGFQLRASPNSTDQLHFIWDVKVLETNFG